MYPLWKFIDFYWLRKPLLFHGFRCFFLMIFNGFHLYFLNFHWYYLIPIRISHLKIYWFLLITETNIFSLFSKGTPFENLLIFLLIQNGDGLDLCEMCGGAARTLKIAFRRRLRTGRNFDLVTGCDLGDPQIQREFKRYLDYHQVVVVTMAPNCRTWGHLIT